jgi:uncharacterized low-complexity protein
MIRSLQMTRNTNLKRLSLLTGAALAMSVSAAAPAIAAEGNPFGMTELSKGLNLAEAESKCGAAKCGGSKKASTESKRAGDKAAESKCGGSKAAESKCGGKAAESKCGGSKTKVTESKCGGMN